jgi:hypothetical protein
MGSTYAPQPGGGALLVPDDEQQLRERMARLRATNR